VTAVEACRDFLEEGIDHVKKQLSNSVLNSILENQGPSAMIGHIVAQIDYSSAFFNDRQEAFKVPNTHYHKSARKTLNFLDRFVCSPCMCIFLYLIYIVAFLYVM
jgi:hypothetical protein